MFKIYFLSKPIKTFFFVKDWFEINPQNGSIYTKENIDREIAETIELVIGVEDLNAAENFKPQIITSKFK